MVIVRIWEGLGNQLFQYAYARCLQERTGDEVYLDRRHYNRGDLPYEKDDGVERKFQLQHFNTTMHYADTGKIKGLSCMDGRTSLDRLQYKILQAGFGSWKYLEDADCFTEYAEKLLNPQDKTYINAHCTNKKYYEGYRDLLLEELQPRRMIKYSVKLRQIMENKNTVSIHIRLTDYFRNPGAICQQNYYDRAIRYVCERLEYPFFIIFSDDVKMAKKRFRFPENSYWIENENLKDYQELLLISNCNHNIMAGSTYSYWGAWLNNNPKKIVIAPRKWFRNSLYEKNWITY